MISLRLRTPLDNSISVPPFSANMQRDILSPTQNVCRQRGQSKNFPSTLVLDNLVIGYFGCFVPVGRVN